ncbi:MAG: hypothetical protein ACREPM_15855 [Gemmatimonadaceae bacterium]
MNELKRWINGVSRGQFGLLMVVGVLASGVLGVVSVEKQDLTSSLD